MFLHAELVWDSQQTIFSRLARTCSAYPRLCFARSKAWMPTDRSPWAEGPRHKAGQRRNWGCDVPPFIASRVSPDSPAPRGERVEKGCRGRAEAYPELGEGGATRSGIALEDRRIADLPALLRPGDLLVFNDTKVIPARLVGFARSTLNLFPY
jgi:hypothetical protein